MNNKIKDIHKDPNRLKILKKIELLEEEGKFDIDAEEDPPTIELKPDKVDYLNEKFSSRIKSKVAYMIGKKFLDGILKEDKLIIKEIKGIENLKKVDSGALITCNHFNPFDCFTIEKVFRVAEKDKTKKLYKIIREGNYTNFPGIYGFLFRNCDTLPLSSNRDTMKLFMKSVDTILRKGDFILIYPEQSLWWNYKKPKPLKDGAFRLASRNNVPIIPIFITMQDSSILGDDGFFVQEYTVNIGEPIYPSTKFNEKENAISMKEENEEYCKNIYEKFYGIPLKYTTKNKE